MPPIGEMKMTDLRVILYREEDQWVAQVLEHDIRAQATSLTELLSRLDAVVASEKRESTERHGEAFKGIDPAPNNFFKMWGECPGSYEPSDVPSEGPYQMALCA